MSPDISKDGNELAAKAANWFVDYVNKVLQSKDRCTIALAGGNTPKKLYELLASDAYKNKIDWTKLHFFWGDERYVPFEDERNNAKMVSDILFNHVPVPKEHIHIMRTDIEPEQSAAEYESILKDYFGEEGPSFDIVLLGMGNDGHTLSLFPGNDNIHEKEKWVMAFYLDAQKMYRITLTTTIVNRACEVVFLVTGADKAVTLFQVLYGEHDPELYPTQLIQPYNTAPVWFIDSTAATEIES